MIICRTPKSIKKFTVGKVQIQCLDDETRGGLYLMEGFVLLFFAKLVKNV